MDKMTFPQLEGLYDALAVALDRVSEPRRPVVLAKLVLLIASELGQVPRILPLIDAAIREEDLAQNGEGARHDA